MEMGYNASTGPGVAKLFRCPGIDLNEVDLVRDKLELELAKAALDREFPVLGICRGIQVLNVAAGGDLYQDLAQQRDGALNHDQDAPR